MMVFEGKYDYIRAGQIDPADFSSIQKLAHPEYQDVADTFQANLLRLASLYELPLQLIYWSGRFAQMKFIARHRAGFDPADESNDDDPKVAALLREAVDKLSQGGGNALGLSANALAGLLGDHGGSGIGPAREGIEAVLAAMVMASYATLETLAQDLWVAAVNRHDSLASNWIAKNARKEFTADIFSHGFNLTGKMGTTLHTMKKVSFESLHDIKNLYSDTFKGAVDDAFDPIDGVVKAEKTRHLFAHRGGLIDQKFQKEMSKYPEYKDAIVGERLRLTGNVTGSHVQACVNCGIDLLLSVDTWGASG